MKVMTVKQSDGSVWAVPVEVIARNRAKYYAAHDPDFDGDLVRSLNEDTIPLFDSYPHEVEDWAANNMNWSEVKEFAFPLRVAPMPDFQKAWVNGEKEVIEVIFPAKIGGR